ncbi:MAG: GDSL-type esterase/lipase family protein [Aggregatilineales bacterium]
MLRTFRPLGLAFLLLMGACSNMPSTVLTPTPFEILILPPAQTFVPTPTPSLTPTITPTFTITPTPTVTPLPSATPLPSNTPLPVALIGGAIDSRICDTCQPYLRASPGTAGRILGRLDQTVTFRAVGRSADTSWLQVELTNDPRGRSGWVFRDLTALRQADVSSLPVTGEVVDATPAPFSAAGDSGLISGVSANARQIFLRGQALGNRAHVFTRVGDSITASPYFLPSSAGGYDLGAYQNELWDTVRFYSTFGSASLAAGNGWGADRILQNGYNAPEICGNEPPLVCEYRMRKPAVALIMIGTNDSGGVDPAVYERNLSRIVEISIEMGVIPVLSTIPPKLNDAWNGERAQQWNNIIKAVARRYDVPLMDYWLALQNAPNYGIEADGIHPSVPPDGNTTRFTPENLRYGYTIRNLVALQALDALRRYVFY